MLGQQQNVPEAEASKTEKATPSAPVISLPKGGDGLRVLETVKAGESPPVVIVLAAFPYPQHRQKCREAGAEYFLDKAAEFDQIAKVLRGLVGDTSWECVRKN